VTPRELVAEAFYDLETAGLVAHTNASCCNTCALAEVIDEMDELKSEGTVPVGYAFYSENDADRWQGSSLFVSFGGRDDKTDIEVGWMVVAALKRRGLTVEWTGSVARKIDVKEVAGVLRARRLNVDGSPRTI
jgi:hypothetical protein